MGKFFNPKITKADKLKMEKLQRRHYTPIKAIASKFYNERNRPSEPTLLSFSTPDYIQEWIRIIG